MATLGEMGTDIKIDLKTNKCLGDPQTIKRGIVNVLEQIHRYKERVSKYIDDNYVDFLPNNTTVYIYLEEGKALEKEGYDMLRSLESSQCDTELTATVWNLKQSVWELDVINRILAADELFQCLEETSTSNEHLMVLDLLKKLNNLIYSSSCKDVQRMLLDSPCYDTIRVKYLLQFHAAKNNLCERFKRLVQYSEKQLPNATCATLQVSQDLNQLHDTVLALFQTNYDVTELCDFLMDKCLTPIITKPVIISFSEENPEYLKLQISYSNTSGSHTNSDYKQVFENIKLLFHCLDNLNVLVSDDQHVFGIIGDHLSNRFLQVLIDECLMNAVPDSLDAYQSSSLVEDILQFEHLLADLYLINREVDQTLTNFTERFETLFHNLSFRRILENGREIMQKDMQDMTVMAEKNTPEDVANNPFLFPRCMVSKSVLDFVKLLNRIVRQDSETHNEEGRFLSIISVLVNSYVTLVPQFHKEQLKALPQLSVLFYNNCMFLHHWMAKNFGIPTVSNLVKNLISTGAKYLRQQINQQLSELERILQPEAASTTSTTSIPLTLVNKCLVHLELLASQWQPVLPVNVYNKTMGELINSCCFILNQHVLTKETITNIEAKILSDTYELFKTQCGKLFKVGHELQSLVNWQRLKHLLEIIKASLTEITEMWSMGELNEYFKAEEIIGLIRSIHPNTERRALALKKIF